MTTQARGINSPSSFAMSSTSRITAMGLPSPAPGAGTDAVDPEGNVFAPAHRSKKVWRRGRARGQWRNVGQVNKGSRNRSD
jgi:hypothetical protein